MKKLFHLTTVGGRIHDDRVGSEHELGPPEAGRHRFPMARLWASPIDGFAGHLDEHWRDLRAISGYRSDLGVE